MRYFVNLANMCKYATNSPTYIDIFSKGKNYIEVTREEFDELPYVF